MRKDEIHVGDRLALCSPGYDRENFRGTEVEVVEVGVPTSTGSWRIGSVTGSKVRYVANNREVVVNNLLLWKPWIEYMADKIAWGKAQHRASLRARANAERIAAEDAEISKALDSIGSTARAYGSHNHTALLALARKVNS